MLLSEALALMPVIMISCTILVIISFCLKNEKAKKYLFIIGAGIAGIYVYFIMGIIVPYIFINGIFEGIEGYIWLFAITIIVWAIISLYISLKNIIIFNNNREKNIYVRDVEVDYSPAVCSYLMNNRIETKKDLTATLLNLCAKNIVKIEKNENNINIIDLNNNEQVVNLKEDEKYAYEMLISKVTNNKLIEWKNKVEEEYMKYNFSKKHEKPLGMYIFWLYIAIFVAIFAFFIITGENSITGAPAEIIAKLLLTSFLAAWEIIIVSSVTEIIKSIFKRNKGSEFKDTYTSKGAREVNKWKRYISFMNDYSLIDEKTDESVEIWGKYLSYSIALGINKNCDKELYKKIQKEYSFEVDIFSNISEDINN